MKWNWYELVKISNFYYKNFGHVAQTLWSPRGVAFLRNTLYMYVLLTILAPADTYTQNIHSVNLFIFVDKFCICSISEYFCFQSAGLLIKSKKCSEIKQIVYNITTSLVLQGCGFRKAGYSECPPSKLANMNMTVASVCYRPTCWLLFLCCCLMAVTAFW